MKNNLTAQEFLALGEKKKWQMNAIVKEMPVGSGRRFLFGFEFKKRSRKYVQKYMLAGPVNLEELGKGPIKKQSLTSETQPIIHTRTHGPLTSAQAARILSGAS